jgi:hypothetical protein
MFSKTYAISWDGSIENCLELDRQLSNSGLDYLIYNVAEKEVESKNWARAENIRYYGHLYNALKDFKSTDYEVFIFNAGDPVYSDFVSYTKRTEKFIKNDKEIYAIAPDTTNDGFSGNGSFICPSETYKNLDLSLQTNGIHFAFSRELALFMEDYMTWAVENNCLRVPEMSSGWGVDIAACALAIYKNKKVYRDISLTMVHPEGSSTTDQEAANSEMIAILESFKKFCEEKGMDPAKIQSIYDFIFRKCRYTISYTPSIKDIYLNLEGDFVA